MQRCSMVLCRSRGRWRGRPSDGYDAQHDQASMILGARLNVWCVWRAGAPRDLSSQYSSAYLGGVNAVRLALQW